MTGTDFWSMLLEPALGFDMAITGWGPDFDDPFTYMGYWVSSSKDMGATFDNAEYDAILDRANAETDLVKRAELLGAGRGALRRHRPLGALHLLQGRRRGAAAG